MSHKFAELPLPEAIEEIRRRIYGDFNVTTGLQEIADRLGVGLRTVQSWRTGETSVDYKYINPLKALAKSVNVAIEPASMVRGTGSRKRGKK